jgi:type I restriction enzyme S subunit
MSEWKKCKIGDLVTLKQGFAINAKSKHYISKERTSLALLRIADMKSGAKEIFIKENIPQNFIAKKEDIIYTRTGNIGLVFRNNYGVVHNNCFTVTPNEDSVLSRDFLFYLLQNKDFYEKANSLARGAAQPDLPHSLFNSIEILYPSFPTQNRIATILSRYDSLIENYQKQIKLLEEAAQRLYKEWFVDLHFPGHENTKIVDGVPEGWDYYRISERYKTVLGGTPSRAKSNYWGGNIPWINSGEINKLRIINASEMITQEGYDNSSTKLMPIHTTILAITGATLGQVSYTEIETCANQSVVGIIDESNQTNEYLYLNISNNILSIVNKATGGAQQHINKDIVNDYPILVPDDKTLTSFKKIVSPMFALMKELLLSVVSLTEARDRLLPKLMSGEIKVS